MKSKLIYAAFLLSGIIAVAVSFSFDTIPSEIKFIVPKEFPKPEYDFSKNKITGDGFKLGRKLFFDPVLSRDSSTSCASCHLQFTGFTHVDHALSHGINGLKGTRNSMTLCNLAWSKSFMWDGGVTNLEVQPVNPITNPAEMDNTLQNIVDHLNKSEIYKAYFAKVFGDTAITGQKILKALAQFTVMLESYNSKYDKYIRKETGGEMTMQELSGLKLFRSNCAQCHREPLFTNNLCMNNGLPADTQLNDVGRMKITGDKNDSLKFKVPSLRNVEMSYPYMHDGRFRSLEQVLDHYTNGIQETKTLAAGLKKPIILTEQDKKDIIAFLKTLTDKEFLYDLRFRNYAD